MNRIIKLEKEIGKEYFAYSNDKKEYKFVICNFHREGVCVWYFSK